MKHGASHLLLGCAALAALLACSRPAQAPSAPAAPVENAAALPFLENDFVAALSLAQEKNLPLFVEVWAPW